MQKSIGAFIGSLIVAAAVIAAGFYWGARNRGVTGSGDAAPIVTETIRALVDADIGHPLAPFNDQETRDDWRRAAATHERSAQGLTKGARRFAGLVANPNVTVSSAAKAGVEIFTAIASMDREAVDRLGLLGEGMASRDSHLGWFFDMERERAALWNRVGAEVTKPLADAAVLDSNAMTPRLRLTKRQRQEVRLAFAQAAADLGGTSTLPARLVDDFHWRLFGTGLFGGDPRHSGPAGVIRAVGEAENPS